MHMGVGGIDDKTEVKEQESSSSKCFCCQHGKIAGVSARCTWLSYCPERETHCPLFIQRLGDPSIGSFDVMKPLAKPALSHQQHMLYSVTKKGEAGAEMATRRLHLLGA